MGMFTTNLDKAQGIPLALPSPHLGRRVDQTPPEGPLRLNYPMIQLDLPHSLCKNMQ